MPLGLRVSCFWQRLQQGSQHFQRLQNGQRCPMLLQASLLAGPTAITDYLNDVLQLCMPLQ